jgi:hypothetical protein
MQHINYSTHRYNVVHFGETYLRYHTEAHIVVAALLMISAVAADCITAVDQDYGVVDSPASMRTSSLVLVLTLASPVIKPNGYIVDQRVCISVALALAALYGKHVGNGDTRTGDVVYTVFVLGAAIWIIIIGGVNKNRAKTSAKDNANECVSKRQTVSGFCAAMMTYVGLRGVRMAFVAPELANDFSVLTSVSGVSVRLKGYTHLSTSTTMPLSLGHGVLVATGLLIGLHGERHMAGSGTVALDAGCGAVVMMVAAACASLSYSEQIDNLPALFGISACSSDAGTCPEAYRARRFAMVAGSSASLWLAALGALFYSLHAERRHLMLHRISTDPIWSIQCVSIALLSLCSALLAVYSYSSTNGVMWHSDICTIVAVLSVFVSAFGNTFVGTIMYFVAAGYEEYMVVYNYGAASVFVHLTHCTLFLSLCLMAVYLSIGALNSVTSYYGVRNGGSILDDSMMLLATFGTSLTFGLYVASAILIAGTNGAFPDDSLRDNSGKRTCIVFLLNHYIPLFAWVPLYVSRSETKMFNSHTKSIVWALAVPLDIVVYTIVLYVIGVTAPATGAVDMFPAGVALLPSLIAWAVAGYI